MVILKSQYPEETLCALNDFLYFKFCPDLQVGETLLPHKLDGSFKFISSFLFHVQDGSQIDETVFEELVAEVGLLI